MRRPAGILAGADGLGTNLAGEVNFHNGVDGNHVVVLTDYHGIGDIRSRTDDAVGILVEHIEQVVGAAGKAEDMLRRGSGSSVRR